MAALGVALFLLGSYVTMYSRQWFMDKDTFRNSTPAHWHFTTGVSLRKTEY